MTGLYWSRIKVQASTPVRTPAGGTTYTYADVPGMGDVEARIIPAVREDPVTEMTVLQDDVQVHLRGAWPDVRPTHRVLDGADAYDIRRVIPPPPFGEPVTVLETVRLDPSGG